MSGTSDGVPSLKKSFSLIRGSNIFKVGSLHLKISSKNAISDSGNLFLVTLKNLSFSISFILNGPKISAGSDVLFRSQEKYLAFSIRSQSACVKALFAVPGGPIRRTV